METQPPPLANELANELASALDWWQEAGVDCEFTDDATDWLSPADQTKPEAAIKSPSKAAPDARTAPTPPPAKLPERADLLGPSPPGNLEEFRAFWMEAPGLDAIGPRGRVPPRGERGAKLMVLVTDPEDTDRDRLLSGPQGELLSQILKAMTISDTEVYFASALTRPTPMADTAAIGAGGMDAVTLHHIALAQPKAVLAFGLNILPLVGAGPPKEPASLREINLSDLPKPFMLTDGLDSLLAMPRLKARLWRRWIEWSAEVF